MAEEARDSSDERREWEENRRKGLFATDTPKILMLSRWGTPLSVYREKVGESAPRAMSLYAWLGLKLENTVAELYTQATGQRVRADHRTIMHPRTPFPMGTHLDFRAWGKPKLLVECKTRAYSTGYGPDGSDQIPPDVWAQVQHELYVTGADECHVAVLFGHVDFRVYVIPRHDEFLEKLVPRLEGYWYGHIVPRIPPPPSGHELDSDIVKDENRDHGDIVKAATPEQEKLVQQLILARRNVAQATLAEAELENRVKQLIGDAAGLSGSFWKVSWKKSKDSSKTDWELVAGSYRQLILDHRESFREAPGWAAGTPLFETDLSAIQSIYTVPKPGTRRFLVDLKGEEA